MANGNDDAFWTIIREFFNGKCQKCERLAPIERMKDRMWFIYHKDFDHSNNAIENLELLCRYCHVSKHWQRVAPEIELEPEKIKELTELIEELEREKIWS